MDPSPVICNGTRLSSVKAWSVFAWPSVLWQAPRRPLPQLSHLGTYVTSLGNPMTPCAGQTVWGEPLGDQAAGLAWDWIELAQGVIAMLDPMGVITNVRWLDANGRVLTPSEAAPYLNELVHSLPWQCKVQQVVHSEVQWALQHLAP